MTASLAIVVDDSAPRSDTAIVACARDGDADALRAIYEAHATRVTRRLMQLCGDPEVARDLAQDAFVTAISKLHRFRGDSSLATWLHAIAFNHLRDHRKRVGRRQTVWAKLRQHQRDREDAPQQAIEELDRLREVLSRLDDAKRDAFVLRVIEQLSLEEAAAILGVRKATVSYRARRAEALVRAAFETMNAEEGDR